MEVVCAMAVLTIAVTAVWVGEEAQLRAVGRSYDELAASRAAAAHLEALAAAPEPLTEGAFDVAMPGCAGARTVRAVEPGLFEVTAVVRRGDRELARLTTLLATREAR